MLSHFSVKDEFILETAVQSCSLYKHDIMAVHDPLEHGAVTVHSCLPQTVTVTVTKLTVGINLVWN